MVDRQMATQAMFANDRDAAADRLPDPGQREVHRLRTAFDLAKDAILFLVPPTMQIVDANRAACDLLGYSYDELLRLRLHDIAPNISSSKPATVARENLQGNENELTFQAICQHKQDYELPVDASFHQLDNNCLATIAVLMRSVHDPTQRVATAPEACRDALTGLPNRAVLDMRLNLAMDGMHAGEQRFSLFFVDIDRFKQINDTWGHVAGDRVLQLVARRIVSSVRPSDLVARYGGDEFIVLVEGVSSQPKLGKLAGRILQSVAEPFDAIGRQIVISVSIGIAIGSNRYDTVEELVHASDKAMYQAKALGRDGRFVIHGCSSLDCCKGDRNNNFRI